MDKVTAIFGIDVSKSVLDIYNDNLGHFQVSNSVKGFETLQKKLGVNSLVVMEATGYYHYMLAQYLSNRGVRVSVVNPLSVKRFLQMKLAKIKTDKSDAKAIYEYALFNEVPLYTSLDSIQAECLQIFRLLDNYQKKLTATKNKLHGEKALGIPSKIVFKSLERDLKHLKKEMKLLEEHLMSLVKQEHEAQLSLLKTIPGLGNKTALFLIVLTTWRMI